MENQTNPQNSTLTTGNEKLDEAYTQIDEANKLLKVALGDAVESNVSHSNNHHKIDALNETIRDDFSKVKTSLEKNLAQLKEEGNLSSKARIKRAFEIIRYEVAFQSICEGIHKKTEKIINLLEWYYTSKLYFSRDELTEKNMSDAKKLEKWLPTKTIQAVIKEGTAKNYISIIKNIQNAYKVSNAKSKALLGGITSQWLQDGEGSIKVDKNHFSIHKVDILITNFNNFNNTLTKSEVVVLDKLHNFITEA